MNCLVLFLLARWQKTLRLFQKWLLQDDVSCFPSNSKAILKWQQQLCWRAQVTSRLLCWTVQNCSGMQRIHLVCRSISSSRLNPLLEFSEGNEVLQRTLPCIIVSACWLADTQDHRELGLAVIWNSFWTYLWTSYLSNSSKWWKQWWIRLSRTSVSLV